MFYSRTNKTKQAAEKIAQLTGAQISQIKDKKNRDGPIQYMIGALDSIRGKKTVIEYKKEDFNKYDTIYVGTPVWASKPTPAILEFIEQNDFKDKNIITFTTMSSNGDKKTIEILNNKIKQKGGNIVRSFAIKTKDTDIDELTKQAMENS